jgi:hypothetical protein
MILTIMKCRMPLRLWHGVSAIDVQNTASLPACAHPQPPRPSIRPPLYHPHSQNLRPHKTIYREFPIDKNQYIDRTGFHDQKDLTCTANKPPLGEHKE